MKVTQGKFLKILYLPTLVVLASVALASPAFALCDPVPQIMNGYLSDCYICDFVSLLLGAINSVATQSFDMMGDVGGGPAISLMAIGFALWLGWHVGNYFINYKYPDPMEFVTELGRCAFRVTFIAAILMLPASLAVDFVISPIITMATELILGLVNTDVIADIIADNSLAGMENFCGAALNDSGLSNGMALSPQVLNSILCMVQAIYYEAVKGVVVGEGIACNAQSLNLIIFSIPDIGMWIIGVIIFIVFLFIVLTVSFALVDYIVRIGFVLIMLPLLLVAWVFPITRQYTKRGWELFLNSLVALVAMAIAVGLILKLLFSVLGNSEQVDACINEDRMHDLYNIIYTNGFDWILFIVILFLSVIMIKTATAIANHFVVINPNLGAVNIGAAVGGRMMAAAANLIKGATTVAVLAASLVTGGGAGAAAVAAKGAATAATTAASAATKAAASAAAKVAGAAVRTASRAASRMGRFGAAAIKVGTKVSEAASKAASAASKVAGAASKAAGAASRAASTVAKPVRAFASSVKTGYKNIKMRIDTVKSGVSSKLSHISRSTSEYLDAGGRGSHAVLRLARATRKYGGMAGRRAWAEVKAIPGKALDKIIEMGEEDEKRYGGGE